MIRLLPHGNYLKKARFNMTDHKTIHYLNVLRLFACLLVVLSHVIGTALQTYSAGLMEVQIYILKGIHNCIRWHVPIFVMISGALFLDPEKSITVKKMYTKYIFRIVLGIIIWGIIYHYVRITMEQKDLRLSYLGKSILAVITNDPFSHLWYLYMILGLYIIQPVLFQFIRSSSQKNVLLLICVLFLFTSLLPTIEILCDINIYNITVFSITGPYVLYFLLGHLLSKCNFMRHQTIVLISCITILFYILLSFCGKEEFFAYNSPFVVLVACSIFYLAKTIDVKLLLADKVDKLCYGVYICHGFSFQFWYRILKITPLKMNWLISIFGGFFFTVIITFLMVYLMRKIKILRAIL